MQEKPPFSSYLDFFSNVWDPLPYPHLRTLNLSSSTQLELPHYYASLKVQYMYFPRDSRPTAINTVCAKMR